MGYKKSFFKINILILVILLCVMSFSGCAVRKSKYKDALTIGALEIPKTLMPYADAKTGTTFVAGLIYSSLLSTNVEPQEYDFPNGDTYSKPTSDNYFNFTDELAYTYSAYPKKDGSKYGFQEIEVAEKVWIDALKEIGIVKGEDIKGNPILETDEDFLARAEEQIPRNNWHEYHFKLRDGYTWNDGEKFKASDVVFTFNYILKHRGKLASQAQFLSTLYSIKTVDGTDDEFIMTLATNKLSDIRTICNSLLILPEHIWSSIDDPVNYFNENPVGTGAYYVADTRDFSQNSWIVLTYRDNYNKTLEKEMFANEPIKHIMLQQFKSNEILLKTIENGEVDVFLDELDETKALKILGGQSYNDVNVSTYDTTFVTTLTLNVGTLGAFNELKLRDSVKVREAISLAINQEELITKLKNGQADTVGNGLVPNGLAHALTDSNGNYVNHEFNIGKANAILDTVYPNFNGEYRKKDDGSIFSYTVLCPKNATYEPLVLQLADQLKKIGIKLSYERGDDTYTNKIDQQQNAKFDMIINSVSFDVDQLLMFDARFGRYAGGAARKFNYSGINDTELSALMKKMDTSVNILEQYEYAKQVQEKVASVYVELPLYKAKKYSAYSTQKYDGFINAKNASILNSYSTKYISLKK